MHQEFTAMTSVYADARILDFVNTYEAKVIRLAKIRRSTKETLSEIDEDLSILTGDTKKCKYVSVYSRNRLVVFSRTAVSLNHHSHLKPIET